MIRVLVAEDCPSTRLSVAAAIRSFGYEAATAANAEEAWRLLEQGELPILVADYMGLDLCRRIRATELPHYTYVIVMTGKDDRSHLIEALSAGADDFITKPYDPEELQVRLTVAGRIVRLESQLREANEVLRRQNERLHVDSRLDPLMGIGNRAAFDERVRQIHEWAASSERSYGVVMCDLDHFKCYNDTFGHQVGDEVLKRVAGALKVAVRATDWAFRYGGEEMVLLLEGHDLESAARIAERVRTHVEAMDFALDGVQAPFRVTVSCGVASYPDGSAEEWRQVVNLADQALYAAKRRGRNQTAAMRAGVAVPVARSAAIRPPAGTSTTQLLHSDSIPV